MLSALNRVPRVYIIILLEADTSRPVTSPHRPSITASLEEEPRGEAPSSVAVSRVVNRTIDSVDETAELSSIAPPLAEDTSNKTVQSLAFIKADTSINISTSSMDLSTSHTKEDPDKVLSK